MVHGAFFFLQQQRQGSRPVAALAAVFPPADLGPKRRSRPPLSPPGSRATGGDKATWSASAARRQWSAAEVSGPQWSASQASSSGDRRPGILAPSRVPPSWEEDEGDRKVGGEKGRREIKAC